MKVKNSILLFKTSDLGSLANTCDLIKHFQANSQRWIKICYVLVKKKSYSIYLNIFIYYYHIWLRVQTDTKVQFNVLYILHKYTICLLENSQSWSF